MVGERRYGRKWERRNRFKHRASKKNAKKRSASLTPLLQSPEFNASGSSLYSWIHVPPVAPHRIFEDTKINRGQFTQSLSQKCAEVVGDNADALLSSYLENASWSCWRIVWLYILKKGNDSPEIFRMFARQFGDQLTFPCHSEVCANTNHVYTSLLDLRKKALNACLVPVHRTHRVENVFSNISVKDFVAFVDALKMASVIIDVSKILSYSATEVLSLCNITNLKALDLSNIPHIGDQFLYTIKSRITSRASALQILSISGCPNITEVGLSSFLEGTERSNLVYVESDKRLSPQIGFADLYSKLNATECNNVVAGTRWRLIRDEDKLAKASKYKLGLKYHFLSRQMSTIGTPKLLWDFKFFPQTMNVLDPNVEDLLFTGWKDRLLNSMKKPVVLPFVYIKDAIMNVDSQKLPIDADFIKSSGCGESTKSQRSKRPKLLNTSAKAFFYGT